MLERVIMPDGLKRQTRFVVPTKTVWWNKSIAVFVHDFQVLTVVHQALKELNSRGQLKPAENLEYDHPVIVKVFGNWYRARVERLYRKYASLFLTDVGRFLEKVPVRGLLAMENLSDTIAFSPGVELRYFERFHPHRFQIPDPDVLRMQGVKECIGRNVWFAKQPAQENGEDSETSQVSEFPLIRALETASGEYLADRLEPLLGGRYLSERPPVCLLSATEFRSSEEVSVVRADGTRLEVQLAKFSAEELARLECELSVLQEQEWLETADVLLGDELVAVLWNEKTVRGRVIEFGTSTSKVRLVDYGILVNRPNARIWKLPNDLADRLPAYGLCVEARNGAPEINDGNNILVLCDIQFDQATNVAIADVFPAVDDSGLTKELRTDGEYCLSTNGFVDESTEKLDASVDETATLRYTVEPPLEIFDIDAPTNQVAIDSLSSFQIQETEPLTSDQQTIPVDPVISPMIESYLVMADGTGVLAAEEDGDLELSSEFGALSNLVGMSPDNDEPETSPAVENSETIEATWESEHTHPTVENSETNVATSETEQTHPVVENCETNVATWESEQTHPVVENSETSVPTWETEQTHPVVGNSETNSATWKSEQTHPVVENSETIEATWESDQTHPVVEDSETNVATWESEQTDSVFENSEINLAIWESEQTHPVVENSETNVTTSETEQTNPVVEDFETNVATWESEQMYPVVENSETNVATSETEQTHPVVENAQTSVPTWESEQTHPVVENSETIEATWESEQTPTVVKNCETIEATSESEQMYPVIENSETNVTTSEAEQTHPVVETSESIVVTSETEQIQLAVENSETIVGTSETEQIQPAVEIFETVGAASESEQTHLQENHPVDEIPWPCVSDHMVNGHEEMHWTTANRRIAERSVSKRSSESEESRDFRGLERYSRERRRDTVHDQWKPTSNWQRPRGFHEERDRGTRAPHFQSVPSGCERRRTLSKPRNPDPCVRQCSTERANHGWAAPLSQQRCPGNSRAAWGSLPVEASRFEANHQIRPANGLPDQTETKSKTSRSPCPETQNKSKWSVAHDSQRHDQAAAHGVKPDGESVTIAQEFLVEYILGEGEGLLLGVDHMRRKSIQEMLSQLPLDSLQEIPLRQLKIDQLVLMEHMSRLVRGTVVEITRLKIELKGADEHKVCSATKVYKCPEALADPRTTLLEIQLHSPSAPLCCGDLILVNEGRYVSEDRLVALSYEYRSRREQTRNFA